MYKLDVSLQLLPRYHWRVCVASLEVEIQGAVAGNVFFLLFLSFFPLKCFDKASRIGSISCLLARKPIGQTVAAGLFAGERNELVSITTP